MMRSIQRHALYLSWTVALLATLISLYWSEVRHMEPCALCWYQRVFTFSLVIILGVAAYRSDRAVLFYAKLLAYLGALFALYHIFVQKLGWKFCKVGPDCSEDLFNFFGFVTAPMFSLAAFLLILFFLYQAKK